MSDEFELKPPFSQNVFTGKKKEVIGAYTDEILARISVSLENLTYSSADTIKCRKDSTGELIEGDNTPEKIHESISSTAAAYLAYRMGSAVHIDCRDQDSEDGSLVIADDKTKEKLVRSWIKTLEKTYGAELAQEMVLGITETVDAIIYDYFPQMKEQDPHHQASETQTGHEHSAHKRVLQQHYRAATDGGDDDKVSPYAESLKAAKHGKNWRLN